MDSNEEIIEDDELLDNGEEYEPLDHDPVEVMEGLEGAEEEEEDIEEGRDLMELEQPKLTVKTSFRAKLVEILKNLLSAEVKIYSEASKEFIGLLGGDSGGDILREYLDLSPNCSELLESWRLHQGKPGMSHITSLFKVILGHPIGKMPGGGVIRKLHNLAHSVLKEKLDDIYTELSSQEYRRQSEALLLLASMVKIGVGLASEVAKVFDFKLPVLSRLSGVRKKKGGGKDAKHGSRQRSTRRAYVKFAMSFVESGNSRLLRWILQQRDLYSGVLRGLGGDDVETIVYTVSTLRDKVLSEGSLIPPGLRSVLFGSITLDQLINISGNPMAGRAADLAHEVLVLVCTDPCNGLMPDMNLKGNYKRLFDLMKKLKATESEYHKELLLAIVRRRPSMGAAYMDEFPYNLKPRSSSSWFSAVSLIADMISSVNFDNVAVSLTSGLHNEPTIDNPELQNILKCIIPRPFTRTVISTGLQHSDDPVKHGTLRVVLESLTSLDGLMLTFDRMVEISSCKQTHSFGAQMTHLHGLPGVNCFEEFNKSLAICQSSCRATDEIGHQKWISFKQLIQDEVRAILPEPQVLLKLLSSSGQRHASRSGMGLKRCASLPEVGSKKLKLNETSENVDIIICGVDTETSDGALEDWDKLKAQNIMQELDAKKDDRTIISEIWGLSSQAKICDEPNSSENIFQSKLLDTFKYYLVRFLFM